MRTKACFALLLLLAACDEEGSRFTTPAPVGAGVRPERDAEEELSEGRKRWIERIHRTAPGVDWREIERENGRRAQERRNELRGSSLFAVASPWSEVGSSNQAGRVHCVARGADGTTLNLGSDRGGVWRGSANGSNWQPLGDNLFGGTQELIVLPGNLPGDPDVRISFTEGGTVRRSADDGATWTTPAGVGGVSSIRAVGRLLDGSSTVLALARQSGQTRLLASTNKGQTFSVRYAETQTWDGSMWIPRQGAAASNEVYLLHKGQLKRSVNSGFAFTTLGTVDAAASAGVLSGSEAGAPTLYAAVSAGGAWDLYRSTIGGTSFQKRATIGDFWGPLCASILSPDLVMYGGVEAHRSTDGGATFQVINTWGAYYANPATRLHADLMGIYCLPDPPSGTAETWYFGTDGGLFHSLDQGSTVANLSLSGLGISQYYSTLTSASQPKLILAGAQDQGYQRGTLVPPAGAGPSTPFAQLISGDYGHLTSSDGSHDYAFSTYPGFILVQEGQTIPKLYQVAFPSGTAQDWLPAVVADPLQKTAFFFLANQLYRYQRSPFAPSYPASLYSAQDFAAGSASYLTAMAFAPGDPQRAYAVNDAGQLFWSTDHAVTWVQQGGGAPYQQYFYGNAIDVNPNDPLECVIGGSGYSAAGVIRTLDGGVSWQPLVNGLPPTHIYDLAYAGDGSGDIYAGAESGVWRYDRAANQWLDLLGAFAPLTTYWSVEAVAADSLMRFGSYGRGIWDYHLPTCAGVVLSYGGACLGSGGVRPSLAMTGCPSPGKQITLRIEDGPGGSTALLVFGVNQAQVPLSNGCLLAVSPLLPLVLSVPLIGAGPGNGSFTLDYTLPANTVTGSVTVQALVVDPGAAGGFTSTNGIQVTVN